MAVTGGMGVAEVLLLAVMGVVFIAIAVNDKGGARSDDGSRRLPTPPGAAALPPAHEDQGEQEAAECFARLGSRCCQVSEAA
jgi:hypothetical protein